MLTLAFCLVRAIVGREGSIEEGEGEYRDNDKDDAKGDKGKDAKEDEKKDVKKMLRWRKPTRICSQQHTKRSPP